MNNWMNFTREPLGIIPGIPCISLFWHCGWEQVGVFVVGGGLCRRDIPFSEKADWFGVWAHIADTERG